MKLPTLFKTYPVQVHILEKRGDSIQWFTDKARREKEKDGNQYYKLKKKGIRIKPPEYKYLHLDPKGRPILPLYSPQEGQLVPIRFQNPPNLTVEDKETMFWNILETKKTYDIYPRTRSFWEKYAPFIILAFTAGIMIVQTVIWLREAGNIYSGLANIATTLRETANVLSGVAPGT